MKETPIIYDSGIIPRKLIKTDRKLIEKFCENGCKCYGINGGCPPYAPLFQDLYPQYDYLFNFYVGIEKDIIDFMLKNMKPFTMLKVTTKMLGFMCKRIGNFIEPSMRFLANSYCKECKSGFGCGFGKDYKKCYHPERRRFSLESTGIIANCITIFEWGFSLSWYKRNYVPLQLIQMGGILCNEDDEEKLKYRFKEAINLEGGNNVPDGIREREQRVFEFTK